MGARQYLLPTDSMTLASQESYRLRAIAALIERATTKGVGSIDDSEIPGYNSLGRATARVDAVLNFLKSGRFPKAIDIRPPQNILDFGTALDQWNTAALAVVGTNYSVFQAVAAPVLAANKLAVWYGVAIDTVPMPVSRLTFRSGGAAGNTIAQFDLEELDTRLQLQGFFTEPVVIDPTITFAAQVMARVATGVLARVQLMGFIAEPAGQTIA